MKTVTIQRSDTEKVWSRSQGGCKFDKDGKLGLKGTDGEVILEPIYDQIELCKSFLYTRADDTVCKYYPFGMVEQSSYNPHSPIFYENGKIGLKDENGKILFPAVYDCIKDWSPYDVIYVRNEDGFHYFTHDGKEVLTDYTPIAGTKCDNEPFFIDEKQSTRIIITRRFVKSRKNSNCVKYGDRWVEFDRMAKTDLQNYIGDCEVIPMPNDAYDGINSRSTYIYAGFIAQSDKDNPVEDCVSQLTMLNAYGASWNFITKVWINPDSTISQEELKKFWLIYSNNSDFYSHEDIVSRFNVADWMRIGIGYDKSLGKNEVKVLQVHYFTDRWPDHIETRWVNGLRHLDVKGLKKLKKQLDAYIKDIRINKGEEAAATVHSEILEGCHISSNIHCELTEDDEFAKYDYLKGLGFHCLDTLWYTCQFMLAAFVREGTDNPKALTEDELVFLSKKISWLLDNGAIPNYVMNRSTPLDLVTLAKKLYEYMEWPLESQSILADLEVTMRKKGCRYAREFDINDVFWREFKPGLYDESPFEVKPYTNKVVIEEEREIDEKTFNNIKDIHYYGN